MDDVKKWPANDIETYAQYQLQEGDVVLAMDRPWVKAGLKHATICESDLPCLLVQRTARLRTGVNLDNRFLMFLIGSEAFTRHILGIQTGIGVPHISGQQIKNFEFARPPITEQRRIADNLESLRSATQRLVSIYERKLAALEALKKSLLHRAFAGELTRTMEAGATMELPAITLFPVQIPHISPTDLHAGILAMAYQLHEQHGKEKFFGHVKAEKIAHMLEAQLGIDLGRYPVKNAAGPNDFPRLVKVEHRARMANYFNFRRVDGSEHYSVQKLHGFQRLIDKACTALGQKCGEVERLLQLMLPMTAKQAEIMATVFAAWNNLLIEGKQPTDEQIVFEARENWHPDKLKIDRLKFFAAVQWLREKGIVPEGRGKKVEPKRK